jgi:hypothetical protein
MRSARLKKKLYRNYDNAVKKAERLLVAAGLFAYEKPSSVDEFAWNAAIHSTKIVKFSVNGTEWKIWPHGEQIWASSRITGFWGHIVVWKGKEKTKRRAMENISDMPPALTKKEEKYT